MTYADRSNLVKISAAAGAVKPRKSASTLRVRISSGHFLAALILMIVTTPLFESVRFGIRIETFLMTIVFLSAVLSVSHQRHTLVMTFALLIPAVACMWLRELRPGLLPHGLASATGVVFIGFVGYQLLCYVLRARRVTSQVLCAAVSAYLTFGICWAGMYSFISQRSPTAFASAQGTPYSMTPFDAYYFSFVTLSTVGYGDLVPVAGSARMLAITESTGGMFYVALLISRLVAMQCVAPQSTTDDSNDAST